MTDLLKEKIGQCEVNVIHEDIIGKVLKNLPDEDRLFELADFFKVFGDSTRVRILWALSISEMCVCDISCLLGMSQSAISHQLRVLKSARLVKGRRDGKVMYYSLDDEHISGILHQGLDHVQEEVK